MEKQQVVCAPMPQNEDKNIAILKEENLASIERLEKKSDQKMRLHSFQ